MTKTLRRTRIEQLRARRDGNPLALVPREAQELVDLEDAELQALWKVVDTCSSCEQQVPTNLWEFHAALGEYRKGGATV